jgi:hypothetical protein
MTRPDELTIRHQEPTSSEPVHALAAAPEFATGGICYAARPTGLYGPLDEGSTWRGLYGSLNLPEPLWTGAIALSPAFNRDRTIFAGVQGGVLRSFDGGTSWHISLLPPSISHIAWVAS